MFQVLGAVLILNFDFLMGAGQGAHNRVHIKAGIVELRQEHQIDGRVCHAAVCRHLCRLGSILAGDVQTAAASGGRKVLGLHKIIQTKCGLTIFVFF